MLEYGLSSFRDIQKATLQELPEKAPPGQLPISIRIILQNSLCNTIKPGDQVQAIGIYMLLPTHRTKQSSVFDKYFVVFSVKTLEKQVEVKKTSRVNFPKP
jgi:DNA replication licensing factor MCM3